MGMGGSDVLSLTQPLQSSSLSFIAAPFAAAPDRTWVLVQQSGSTNYVGSSIETLVFPDETISFSDIARGLQLSPNAQFGTRLSEVMNGTAGNDVFFPRGGNDFVQGNGGLDTALFQGPRGSYSVASVGSGADLTFDVADLTSGRDGTDRLVGIERLKFADTSVALDLQGAAGMTAKLIGALFGRPSVLNKQFVGVGLSLFDAGMSYDQVAAAAVATDTFAQFAGDHSNAAFVSLVYRNIVGTAPSLPELNNFLNLLDSGAYSQATLAVAAAETIQNQQNINLVGLQQTGIDNV
jgi:hypothetical protein